MIEPLTDSDPRPGLSPPQYGLRTMMLSVGLVGLLLASAKLLSPLAAAVLCLLTLAVVAHMAGNSIGTRLREVGSQKAISQHEPGQWCSGFRRAQAGDFAPTTQLRDRKSPGRKIFVATCIGGTIGTVFFSCLLAWIHWPQINLWNMSLALVASAVLCGLATFLTSSFCEVFSRAVAQAQADTKMPND